jgi:hypothetical protein
MVVVDFSVFVVGISEIFSGAFARAVSVYSVRGVSFDKVFFCANWHN